MTWNQIRGVRNYAPLMRRLLATILLGWALVLTGAGSALAGEDPGEPPDWCFEPNASGDLPTCSSTVDGEWERNYPDSADPGMPDGFIALIVVGLVVGVGITIFKVFMARDLARKSGMDPDQATALTLLEDDGLEATYLASNLRGPAGESTPTHAADSAGGGRSVSERLAELTTLLEQGLVTQSEYDARRAAILDSL